MASRRNFAASIGGWSAQHRKTAVFGWLLFVVLAVVIGNMSGTKEISKAERGVGESGRAARIIDDAGIKEPAGEMVLVRSDKLVTEDTKFRAAVDDVINRVNATQVKGGKGPATEHMRSPFAGDGGISSDKHSVLIQFDMTGEEDKAADNIQPVLDAVAEARKAHPDVVVEQFGDASGEKWFQDTIAKDFTRAEWTAVPLALGILLVAFGAVVAALLPVALALTAFVAAGGLLALSSRLMPVGDSAQSVMLLIGLAVGVDYCMFYLRREREERAKGRDPETALRIAAATSGRSVLISGITVIVAMAGMLLSGLSEFESMASATILVVLTAVLGSLTVLPAILSMLGDRVDLGKIPGLAKMRRPTEGSKAWGKILGVVLSRPKGTAVLAGGLLIALTVPAIGMKTSELPIDKELPTSLSIVQTYQHIEKAFPGGPAPAQIVVKATNPDDPRLAAAFDKLRAEAVATGQMHEPIEVERQGGTNVFKVSVPLAGGGNDSTSNKALDTLRGKVIPNTLGKLDGVDAPVTGNTAGSVDFNDKLDDTRLPIFAFVLGFAFLLMLVSFRSIAIAVTAIVLNLLSVGAAYGVMTLVFQEGYGDSLVGTEAPGAIVSWIPMFLFVILFGLSMDYHVFVVSRIREAYDKGMDTKSAVSHGIRTTAGVVTSAATIMVAVFGVFGTLSMQSMKQFGVGLAVAVLLDATIIRGLLLPAVMTLLGDRNWYLPRWLGWLPQMDHGDEAIEAPAPAAEPVPAYASAGGYGTPTYETGRHRGGNGYDESVSGSRRIPRPPVG
ncbi:MMPL family transporter [Embleya sp. NPDC020886]|uniref:MMPL family transporter n=1 Tax=Embleya sp. NPDC020886 TaxID=3363980 RepID=UPI0037B25BBA